MSALGGDAYRANYKSPAIGHGGMFGAGEGDYSSQFQSPKPTDKSMAINLPPLIILADGGDAYRAYYKTPENGGLSLPEKGEDDFKSHFQSTKPTYDPEVRLPYMSGSVGDAYTAYYNAKIRGVSSTTEDAFRSHYQSPKRTDKSEANLPQHTVLLISASGSDAYRARDVSKTKYLYKPNPMRETFMGPFESSKEFALAGGRQSEKLEDLKMTRKFSYNAHLSSKTNKLKPTIAKTGRIFDAVGDKITVSRDVVKASDLIISRIEPRAFGSLINSKVEPIPCNSTNTTDYFTNETECLNSTHEKTEKTLSLRGNHSDETNVDPVATSRNGPVFVNQLYGYQPYLDPVYQYIYPIFLGTCLGTTLMLVVVLIKQFQTASDMSRASISILLAIAVSDALTTGFGLSEVCYRFSETSGNPGFLPYRSCTTMFIIGHLSGVVHEASVWLTVVLTTQRFICVSRPFFARRHINWRVSLISSNLCGYFVISHLPFL